LAFSLRFSIAKLSRAAVNKRRRGSFGFAQDRLFDSAP
jgi:hypothetical protein